MTKPRRRGSRSAPPEKDRGDWRPSQGYLAIALGIAAAGLIIWLMPSTTTTQAVVDASRPAPQPVSADGTASTRPEQVTVAPSRGAPGVAPAAVSRGEGVDPTPDLSHYVAPGEKPTMKEVIEGLHKAGVHTGLGAFSPPGTRPPLVGIAVPEDYPLPPGYVRHYQATDDGQRIEPILMFSPDGAGAARQSAKDRVVPPELAPPGLPIRNIVIPAPSEPGRTGS